MVTPRLGNPGKVKFQHRRNDVSRAGSRHGQGWAEPTQMTVLPTQSELDKDYVIFFVHRLKLIWSGLYFEKFIAIAWDCPNNHKITTENCSIFLLLAECKARWIHAELQSVAEKQRLTTSENGQKYLCAITGSLRVTRSLMHKYVS